MTTKKLSDYEKQGFKGIDAGLNISLFDYGLIWGKDKQCKEDEYIFIYKHPIIENRFDYGYMTKKDFVNDFWFEDENIQKIETFTGLTKAELMESFPASVYDILNYYGPENVFGSSYDEGFKIIED